MTKLFKFKTKEQRMNEKYPNFKDIDIKKRINEKREKLLKLKSEVILSSFQQLEVQKATDEYNKAKEWLLKSYEEIFERMLDNQIGILEAIRDGKVLLNTDKLRK